MATGLEQLKGMDKLRFEIRGNFDMGISYAYTK